jgi:hypothetical protein
VLSSIGLHYNSHNVLRHSTPNVLVDFYHEGVGNATNSVREVSRFGPVDGWGVGCLGNWFPAPACLPRFLPDAHTASSKRTDSSRRLHSVLLLFRIRKNRYQWILVRLPAADATITLRITVQDRAAVKLWSCGLEFPSSNLRKIRTISTNNFHTYTQAPKLNAGTGPYN